VEPTVAYEAATGSRLNTKILFQVAKEKVDLIECLVTLVLYIGSRHFLDLPHPFIDKKKSFYMLDRIVNCGQVEASDANQKLLFCKLFYYFFKRSVGFIPI